MAASSAFETAARRCFTTPEIVNLLSPNTTPLSLSSGPPTSPPPSGSLFLYDRSVTRNYKQDFHDWVKKPVSAKRGNVRVREDDVRLRYGEHYRVAAYYARSATGGGSMRRRSYCLLDPVSLKPENDWVLVHYLDTDVVRRQHDAPVPDSTTGHKVKTEATSHAHTARLVTNADEYSGSEKGLVGPESEEATGKRKIVSSADVSVPFNDEFACYEVDSCERSAGTDKEPRQGFGHSPDTSMLQRPLAPGISSAQHSTLSEISKLLASPKMPEKDVLNEWLSYSEMEKSVVTTDIYGSAVSAEDPNESGNYYVHNNFANDLQLETLTSTISLMNHEISKMHIEDKACYLEALRQCPHFVCSREFKMLFLRCENFCPRAAAHRLVRYWTKRVELFGPDGAFVPLTLEGAMAKYYEKPGFSRMKLLPGLDASGRAILFVDNTIPCTSETSLRGLWYMVHAAIEDDNVKRNGYIAVANRCSPPEEFDRQTKLEQLSLVRDVLPLPCRAAHSLNWKTGEIVSWFVKAYVAVLLFFAGPYVRSRVVFHDGSKEKVILQLAEYGISRNQLPANIGGDFTEEAFRKWLALRREAGK